jgi:sulfate permease, SulP family
VERSPESVRWFVLEAGTVPGIDFSAAASLRELVEDFRGRGVRTAVLLASEGLKRDFDREGLTELIGAENFYYAPQACIDACGAATEVPE